MTSYGWLSSLFAALFVQGWGQYDLEVQHLSNTSPEKEGVVSAQIFSRVKLHLKWCIFQLLIKSLQVWGRHLLHFLPAFVPVGSALQGGLWSANATFHYHRKFDKLNMKNESTFLVQSPFHSTWLEVEEMVSLPYWLCDYLSILSFLIAGKSISKMTVI